MAISMLSVDDTSTSWTSMMLSFVYLVIGAIFLIKFFKRETKILESIQDVVQDMCHGQFEKRITNINEKTELGRIAWKLNDALDQLEAFLRETHTARQYTQQRKYFRKALPAGMRGSFRTGLEDLNKSLAESAKNAESIIQQKEYLSAQVQRISTYLEKVQNKNLTAQLVIEREDAIGELSSYLNKTVQELRDIITRIDNTSSVLSESSLRSSEAVQQLTDTVRDQDIQTDEIVSSVTEMTATIGETSQNTVQAAQLSAQSVEDAVAGQSAVQKTIHGMQTIASGVQATVQMIEKLEGGSERIGAIAKTIEEIADQTDLLALNAAIESARAGEAGKGFAVVADEIRKLAERTQASTKKIANTIRDIQESTQNVISASHEGNHQVAEGITLAEQAGNTIRDIVVSIERVNDIIQQIAITSEQQSGTANTIMERIKALAHGTTLTAENAQEIAEIITRLSEESQRLHALTKEFTLTEVSVKQLSA
jgi:methyl-accepting chemotaxis protein